MSDRIDIDRRKQDREQAFIIIFEKLFSDSTIEEIVNDAVESRELIPSDFAVDAAQGVYERVEEIDTAIKEHLIGWQMRRLSKVVLAIMRLAVYEIMFNNSIPASVSINEAVELSKKYAGKDDPAFINGVLGSIVKDMGEEA